MEEYIYCAVVRMDLLLRALAWPGPSALKKRCHPEGVNTIESKKK